MQLSLMFKQTDRFSITQQQMLDEEEKNHCCKLQHCCYMLLDSGAFVMFYNHTNFETFFLHRTQF